jgi:hypothetical protein
MFIWICLIVIIILVVLLNTERTYVSEPFVQEFDMYNTGIDGYEEGIPAQYRDPKPTYPRGIWQLNKWKSLQYHTRLPWLINKQYSYKDQPRYNYLPTDLPDVGRLRELPLNFKPYFSISL